MPGPMPTSDIKIGDIAGQLNLPAEDLSLVELYDHASTTSGISLGSSGYAGNFHNLAMGVSPQAKFAAQIWAVWDGGSDLPVGNWGNYFYDANVVLDWDISMDSNFKPADEFYCDIYLTDDYNNRSGGVLSPVANFTLSPGQSNVETDFDTGIPAFSTYGTTGYWIYVAVTSNIVGANCIVTIDSGGFGDTDAVGPDTTRSRNVTDFPANVGGGSPPPVVNKVIVSGSNVNNQIAYNKRTSFKLTVTP
jgi:hypothetical protein